MENFEYYTGIIGPGALTKCCKDLLSGRIKISDVPFEFRGVNEYISAHKYARQFKDEKERCWQYWQVAKQLEADIWNLSITEDTKDVKHPYLKLSEGVPEDSEYFKRAICLKELQGVHDTASYARVYQTWTGFPRPSMKHTLIS